MRQLIIRALLLRCPHCGGRGLFRRWVVIAPYCRSCGLLTDRGERDYFIGSYTINFIVAELMIVLAGVIVVLRTWPEVPWGLVQWGLIALMIPFPVLTYPFSKTLYLAIDLALRPPTVGDFAGHGENDRQL